MAMPFTIPASTTSVDVVVYAASLVSNAEAVDAILDDLRLVTSTLGQGKQLSSADEEVVGAVYNKIEFYLTQKDPQRIFTKEELRQKIIDHFNNTNPAIKQLHSQLGLITGLTALAAGLAFLVPQAPTEDSTVEFYALLVLPTVFTMLHMGAAWLFGRALSYFRSQIKFAYRLIVAGIVVLGLAQAQLAVIGAFDLWATFWINDGIVTILYVPAMFLLYLGMRRFAQAIGAGVTRASVPFALGTLFVGVSFALFVPHAANATSELFYRASAVGMAIAAVIATLATFVGFSTLKRVTEFYLKPLVWLTAALSALAVASFHILIVHLFVGYDTWYADYGFAIAPFLVSAAFLLKAGYVFNKLQTK